MGTRRQQSAVAVWQRDHPHAYGDKVCENYYAGDGVGSSPRVWGQVNRFLQKGEKFGIIPTRMGTSRCRRRYGHTCEDHPHAYGDKQTGNFDVPVIQGSSPRVWGQVSLSTSLMQKIRIIPTRMGTSLNELIRTLDTFNHPHAYGDKPLCLSLSLIISGSSPRVWGQASARGTQEKSERIIPTRMGTRKVLNGATLSYEDHPHAYGDKSNG